MQAATLKIKEIKKLDIQADNTTVLDVTFGFFNDIDELEERRHNFPLNTTPEQMEEQLQAVLASYNNDRELAEKNAGLEAAQKQADETIAAMTGKHIEQPGATEQPTDAPSDPAGEENQAQA